jgi:hypothetical protein
VLLECVVNCVNTVIFALEPFHRQLSQFDVAVKVCSHTTQSLEAKLSNFKIVAVTSAAGCLEYFFEVLVRGSDHLGIIGSQRIVNFNFKHHAEMSAVLVDFLVPVDHRLKSAFHTLNYAVYQKLVVVGQKSSCLFGLHIQSTTESVQDKFQGALSLARLLCRVHLHDIHSFLDCFLLRWLAPPSVRGILARATLIDIYLFFFPVVIKIKYIFVADPNQKSLNTFKQLANLFVVSSYVEAFGIVINQYADFLFK